MMSEWKEYRVDDVCLKVISGGTPNTRKSEYYGGLIPWVRTQEINFNRLYDTEIKISDEGLKNSSAKWIPENSIIIAMYGATAGKVAISKIPVTTNQACCNLIINHEKFDYRFIYYNILSRFEKIADMAIGGAQQNLNGAMIKNLPISIPDLPTQIAIAEILSSLDDKIELNNNINKELEKLAQTLFKQWFIDFEFPNENGEPYQSSGGEMVESELGMIPKNWEVRKLSALIRLTGGGTPKRSNAEYWDGKIKWFSIQDIPNDSQVFVVDTKEKITELGLNKSSTKLLPRGTTIITARGTVGKLALVAEPMAMNQSCYGVNGASGLGEFYTYFNLKNAVEKLRQNVHGAVFDTITSNTFDTIKSIYGNNDLANLFEEIVRPMMEQIENHCRENQELSNLRDTLLPKLISGELNVKDL